MENFYNFYDRLLSIFDSFPVFMKNGIIALSIIMLSLAIYNLIRR